MVTRASFAYTTKCLQTQSWDLGEVGRPALVHYTVVNRISVAGAWAWRGRQNDHLIDAGSTATVVIRRARFSAASTFGTAIGTSTIDGDGSMRHQL